MSMSGRLKAIHLLSVGLVLATLPAPAAPQSAIVPEVEESDVATLPEASPHWVIANASFGKPVARIVDGSSGKQIGAVQVAAMSNVRFSPDNRFIYVAETIWTKGNRGVRQDMVTVYDARSLKLLAEIPLTGRLLTGYRQSSFDISPDGKLGFVYDMSPASSVIIVDLVRRKPVSEIEIAGCAQVFAMSARYFGSLCGDGTFAITDISNVKAPKTRQTNAFFDADADPVFDNAVVDAANGKAILLSYSGMIYQVAADGTNKVSEGWSINAAANMLPASNKPLDLAWRPGGRQVMAYHAKSGRLYVLMHRGEFWTQKEPGEELWEVDLASRKVVSRHRLENEANSVVVSQGDDPIIFLNEEENLVTINASYFKTLHRVEGIGVAMMSSPSPQ